MQAILVEQEIATIRRREIEGLHHDDRVGRAHLHAQLAELARVELERERLRVVPLLALQHLDLDDLRRTDVLAQTAADAGLLAGVFLVGEREDAPEAIRIWTLDVGIADRHRFAEELLQRHGHRTTDAAHELHRLSPESRRLPALTPHEHLAPRRLRRTRQTARGAPERRPR